MIQTQCRTEGCLRLVVTGRYCPLCTQKKEAK